MTENRTLLIVAALVAAVVALTPVGAQEEEKKLGWSSTAEFNFVMTAGNSESTTLGFNGSAERAWTKALLQIKAGALKVETTSDLGFAIGTGQDDFTVPEVTATTAENYYLGGKYDHNISERFYWYVAAGWLRNEFSGIEDRYIASGGVGNVWYDREKFSFRTNYGVSYTNQQDVVRTPFVETSYAGLLFNSNLKKRFGKNDTEYGNDFLFNYSLADSDNWRWSMDQYISMSLTEMLALKVSLIWLYNNFPAFREYDLVPAPGQPPTGTVLLQLDELDTIFSISLVVKF